MGWLGGMRGVGGMRGIWDGDGRDTVSAKNSGRVTTGNRR